ncbi:MAG: PHP domain-containing protein, partial [Anaerolineaceae bacterium]|nr:PHP domain-containing protein [Anaerolineaceae bacterium]
MPKPADLAQAAADQAMPALALTDHTGMTGSIAFYKACLQVGVRPIMGLEVDLQLPYQLSPQAPAYPGGRLVLLAMNLEGWRNLCRLSSSLQIGQVLNENTLCTFNQLDKYREGLLCLTGGRGGPVNQMLGTPDCQNDMSKQLHTLKGIFSGRLYIEMNRLSAQDDEENRQLAQIAAATNLPLVAAHPVYYLLPDQSRLQKTVSAIRRIIPRSQLKPEEFAPQGAYFTMAQEMEKRFEEYPAALASVSEIVDRCQVQLELGKPHFPLTPLPKGISATDLLRQKATAGIRKYYSNPSPLVFSRLEHELGVIEERGYEPIFLIAEEMIAFARENGIPSASRGSASSSLVAHCMGITTPDPLELDLYFERFLNPARSTPPDI